MIELLVSFMISDWNYTCSFHSSVPLSSSRSLVNIFDTLSSHKPLSNTPMHVIFLVERGLLCIEKECNSNCVGLLPWPRLFIQPHVNTYPLERRQSYGMIGTTVYLCDMLTLQGLNKCRNSFILLISMS